VGGGWSRCRLLFMDALWKLACIEIPTLSAYRGWDARKEQYPTHLVKVAA